MSALSHNLRLVQAEAAVHRPQRQQRRLQTTCSLRQKHSAAPFTSSPTGGLAPLAPLQRRRVATASEGGAASVGSGWMDMPESQPLPDAPLQVFPRLKERDPYRRLGVGKEASYEEVQEARNFLVEQYRDHEASRESIELALDDILWEKFQVRNRDGFRPPQRGRKTDVSGDAPRLSLWQRVRGAFEPGVTAATIVNDGSIFAALGLWAGWQAASSDPTLPLGAAICFCAWKLYDKRNKRNPDGPYWGGNPVFGALGATLAALILGGLLSFGLASVLPLPPRIGSEGVGLFLMTLALGFTALFLK